MESKENQQYPKLRSLSNPADEKKLLEKNEKPEENMQKFKFMFSCHKYRESILSSVNSPVSYRGFFNLYIAILIFLNAGSILRNIFKHGTLIDPTWLKVFEGQSLRITSILIFFCLNIVACSSLIIEKLLAKGLLEEKIGLCLIIGVLTSLLLVPPILYIMASDVFVFVSSLVMLMVVVCFLKLVSYHVVNSWCRESAKQGNNQRILINTNQNCSDTQRLNNNNNIAHNESLVVYPNNLTLKDMYYYLFAPTLCYDLNFPRMPRIRKKFLFYYVIEAICLFQLKTKLLKDLIFPQVSSSSLTFKEMTYFQAGETIISLALPFHIIWLMYFYWFFHIYLNIIGEILRFGDRQFYREWWNAESIQDFWSKWNTPVHKWCVRHVYMPMIQRGFSKLQAFAMVFFISGIFHEYLMSIPTKTFKIFMLVGMEFQVPLSIFCDKYIPKNYGNLFLWFFVLVGKPLWILLYYYDYYILNFYGG